MSIKFIDLTGMKFGKLTAIQRAGHDSTKHINWLCKCDCGNKVIVKGNGLRRGVTKSCGCASKRLERKHNGLHTPEYNTWIAMKSRCYAKNYANYKEYGGRGITVCDQWRNDFIQFIKDMGPKPDPSYSIDRIDNNGNYEPSNCRWATKQEQSRNQRLRKNNKTGTNGVYERDNKYVARIEVLGKVYCLGTYGDLEEAARVRKEAEIKYWGDC